jgi:D-beta-D-heptose 7-phosphate kinase/D-beta-D-heptose 1-phosphate adenosyltransferase
MTDVLVTGSFDLFHDGHRRFLESCAAKGSKLVVCVDSNGRVRAAKGMGRPIINQTERLAIVQALRCVDAAFIFDSDERLLEIIDKYRPMVRAVGEDWRGKPIVGREMVEDWGGRVEYVPHVFAESTTAIIERILPKWDGNRCPTCGEGHGG